VPFRWDLVTPDQLGSLLTGTAPPDLWFLDDLVACAGKVLARSGNGDLVFVGRSLDSMFDLLSAALADADDRRRLDRLPLSFQRSGVRSGRRWRVIRRKMRFVGVTSRTKTSPNTYRWQQHAAWTRQLRSRAVVNVSLSAWVWSYFGDCQVKLTRSYRPERWLADADGPDRDERTRQALAEAAALVAYGRSRPGRQALARAIGREPALAQPWLRTRIANLNNGN
jgi:hypothetical protein